MEGGSESRAKDETHRSVKPPDQYVISYNFEHAHSLNFTHNLLIGVGHPSKPPRNNHSLPHQPQDKNKLYSIISQPTRVFRSDTRAVATTYQAAPLPKRYRNLPNSTTHQNSSNNNPNYSPDKENQRRVLSKGPKNNQESRIPILKNVVQEPQMEEQHKKSPYAVKGRQKNMRKDKFRVICNEVTEEEPQGNTEQHRSKKIRTKQIRSSNEPSVHNNRNVNQTANRKPKNDSQHSGSPQICKTNSLHSLSSDKHDKNGQNLSAPLDQQHVSLTDFSQEQTPNKQPIETLNFENNTLLNNELKVKESEVVKIPSRKEIQDVQMREIQEIARREESGKMKKTYYKVSGNKEAQILPFQNNVEPLFTKDAKARKLKTLQTSKNMVNNPKIEKQVKSAKPAKSYTKDNYSEANNTFNSPTNVKSDKKPKYFKEPANSVIPRKDSTANKAKINSFQVEAKVNTSYANAPLSNLSQIDEIKTSLSPKKATANRNKASASSDHIGNKRNASNNVQLQKDSQFQRNPSQFIKTSHIKNRNDVPILNRNSQTQQVPLKKSANLQAIASAKRNNKVKPNPTETQKPDHILPDEEEIVEDLTENNQIKGFKIPPKVLQSASNQSFIQEEPKKDGKMKEDSKINDTKDEKYSKNKQGRQSERSDGMKSSGRNNQSPALKNSSQIRSSLLGKEDSLTSRQQQKIKVNPSQHSFRKDSLSSGKPTDKRQSRDKQRNIKNWKQAEMAKAQKESRQTKRRESKREPAKVEHKVKKEKKVEPIDLDAAEKDTFGLHSKKKTIKPPPKKKQQKDSKISQPRPAQNEQIEEIAEQSEQIAKDSNSSKSQRNSDDEEHIKDVEQQLKLRNSAEEEAGLITVNESMGKISRIGSSRAVPEQTIIPFSNQDLQLGEPLQRLNSLEHSQEDDLETLLEAANAQTPLTQQNTHRSALKSNRPAAEKHENNIQNSVFKQEHISEQKKIEENDIEVIGLDAEANTNRIAEDPSEPRKALTAIVQGQNKQKEIVNISNPDCEPKPVLNEQLECSQMGQGREGQIGASRSQDFFQYNIKEISKFNESLNQTFNVTKYQSFDRDPSHYTRAPILSLIYPPNLHPFASSSNRLPATFTHSKPIGHPLLDQTVDLLLSIDSWILQRIFQPFSSEKGQTGVWLYCYGQWKLYQVSGQDNFRGVLLKAVQVATNQLGLGEQLQNWLRIISGVRVVRVKSRKKRVFSELQFSLRKGHCVRAQTAVNSKWGRRLFAVAQVVVSREGENVLQVREGQDVFWVKQEKFRQIFDHFLLICTRKSHFWTSRPISPPDNHKAVIALSSSAAAHGSVTLFYPSSKPASLLLYKELQSRVLRFMGKIQQKPNLNGNLYFQFRLHGNYCLFLEAPTDCLLAVESTTPLEVGTAEFVRSQTLRNEQCEYVELEKAPWRSSVNGKLEQLRERFIKMVIKQ